MTAKKARSRVVTGCLVTTLFLSAGAVVAQDPPPQALGLCWMERDQWIGLRPAAAAGHPLSSVARGLLPAKGSGGTATFVDLLDDLADRVMAPSDAAPAAPPATDAGGPWFRTRFVLSRTAIPCGPEPAVGASSSERPAHAQLEPPTMQAPGTVQKLRRADQR